MEEKFNPEDHPHKRLNILTGEWVLCSPHRTKRPWQGKVEKLPADTRPSYDPNDYLGPTNTRANGEVNPDYKNTFVFTNDFAALQASIPSGEVNEDNLLIAKSEEGICKVICFHPQYNLTLPEMSLEDIQEVIKTWQEEYTLLGSKEDINYVTIFENKGDVMGCSNPHPHGQVWAQSTIPSEPMKEGLHMEKYYRKHGKSILSDYLALELKKEERIIFENDHFVALVPFWAIWPYETMIISKRHVTNISDFSEDEVVAYAETLKTLLIKYDNLFETSFPYSAGIHQRPTDGEEHPEWHFHMHFYPPLLRSATVKKFMVGYEMLGDPQRDITAEYAAKQLRSLSSVHYKNK